MPIDIRHAERTCKQVNSVFHGREIPDQVRDDGGIMRNDGSGKPEMTAECHAKRSLSC